MPERPEKFYHISDKEPLYACDNYFYFENRQVIFVINSGIVKTCLAVSIDSLTKALEERRRAC